MSSALIVAVWPFPVPPPYRGKLPIAQQPVGAVAIRFRSCKDTTFSQHSQKKLLGVYGVHTTSASGGRCGFLPSVAFLPCRWHVCPQKQRKPQFEAILCCFWSKLQLFYAIGLSLLFAVLLTVTCCRCGGCWLALACACWGVVFVWFCPAAVAHSQTKSKYRAGISSLSLGSTTPLTTVPCRLL